MDFPGAVGQVRRRDDVAEAPARDGIGLGKGTAGKGPLEHAGQGGHVRVFAGLVDNMFIHLVGDDEGVEFQGKAGDAFQLVEGERPTRGVGGIAQDKRLGSSFEGFPEFVPVEPVIRGMKGNIDRLGA